MLTVDTTGKFRCKDGATIQKALLAFYLQLATHCMWPEGLWQRLRCFLGNGAVNIDMTIIPVPDRHNRS